ncbi:M48 family metalloprotease [Candidatus Saccharibacteria bacterium]|nr:M48 family metalloprotease [Candidatus Saccharibacteria bacterium]
MYKAIAANKRNTIFVMLAFVAIISAIGAVVAFFVQDNWVIVYTLVIATIYAVIQYFAANKLAVMMTGAKPITRKDSPKLYHVVETISISTGLPMPQIYLIDDPAPNAFASGRDPKHAIVAATTGLLQIMDDKELEAVMAHEMGHVQNYDIRVSMITFGLVCAIGLLANLVSRILIGGSDRRDGGIFMLIAGLFVAILAPLGAIIAQMAVSRQREYLADATSVMTTRYPEAMISALKKLDQYGKPMRKQNAATEAMFINSPLKKGFFNNLFSTHPPIAKRIARLQNNEAKF